jgi:hypothetical protein
MLETSNIVRKTCCGDSSVSIKLSNPANVKEKYGMYSLSSMKIFLLELAPVLDGMVQPFQ